MLHQMAPQLRGRSRAVGISAVWYARELPPRPRAVFHDQAPGAMIIAYLRESAFSGELVFALNGAHPPFSRLWWQRDIISDSLAERKEFEPAVPSDWREKAAY